MHGWCLSDWFRLMVTMLSLPNLLCGERDVRNTCRWSLSSYWESLGCRSGTPITSSGSRTRRVDGSSEKHLRGRCFHPERTGCEWYRECLEKRHPCGDSPYSYALDYAEVYCEKYHRRLKYFSAEGQQWLNMTAYCLKMDLVPYLYTSAVPRTCNEIQQVAFASLTCEMLCSPRQETLRLYAWNVGLVTSRLDS